MSGELSGERSSFFFLCVTLVLGCYFFCLPGPSPVSKLLQWKIEIRALNPRAPTFRVTSCIDHKDFELERSLFRRRRHSQSVKFDSFL